MEDLERPVVGTLGTPASMFLSPYHDCSIEPCSKLLLGILLQDFHIQVHVMQPPQHTVLAVLLHHEPLGHWTIRPLDQVMDEISAIRDAKVQEPL